MPVWLTRDNVREVLTMPAAIDAVEQAFELLSSDHTVLPLRMNMAIPAHQGSLLAMPAYVGGAVNGLGVKLLTLYGENPGQRNLPAIQGNFVLFDPVDGRWLAVMEAGYMTAMRTGAATGVSIRHLARPDTHTVTLFGTGAQAPFQLEAACAERPIRQGWIISRQLEHAEQFARTQGERLGISLTATTDIEEAVRTSDLIITATNAHEPLFDGDWVRPGTHISAVGSHTPDAREVDSKTLQRAVIVTDQRSACLAEAGDILIPLRAGEIAEADIMGELGEIIHGQKPGRRSADEITFFKSVGLAVQDVAVATWIVQEANRRSIGQTLEA